MCDVAPSEWMNPAWMHSYEATEPYSMAGHGSEDHVMGLRPDEASTTTSYYRPFEPGFPNLSPQFGGSFQQNNGAVDTANK